MSSGSSVRRWSVVRFGYHCASSLPRFVEDQVVGAREQQHRLLLLDRSVEEQPEQVGSSAMPWRAPVERCAAGRRRGEVDGTAGRVHIERVD